MLYLFAHRRGMAITDECHQAGPMGGGAQRQHVGLMRVLSFEPACHNKCPPSPAQNNVHKKKRLEVAN